jgi:hypothetical protein
MGVPDWTIKPTGQIPGLLDPLDDEEEADGDEGEEE